MLWMVNHTSLVKYKYIQFNWSHIAAKWHSIAKTSPKLAQRPSPSQRPHLLRGRLLTHTLPTVQNPFPFSFWSSCLRNLVQFLVTSGKLVVAIITVGHACEWPCVVSNDHHVGRYNCTHHRHTAAHQCGYAYESSMHINT